MVHREARPAIHLTVKTSHGTGVIRTTSSHLFYDPYLHQWRPASKLKKGEHLKTPGGTTAVADGGTTPKDHQGWMWDLTVPGNNNHDFYVLPAQASNDQHTHYVVAGDIPILVHNVNRKLDCYDDAAGTGYGPTDKPTRVAGPWTKSDIGRGTRGLRPNHLGDRLQIHHADQMPGSPIHELDQDFHLNADIHRNPFNQGVDSLMRRQDTQLHWWYRSMEQGWGSVYGPEAWFDNWPTDLEEP